MSSKPSAARRAVLILMTLTVAVSVGLLIWNAVARPLPSASTSVSPATTSSPSASGTAATTTAPVSTTSVAGSTPVPTTPGSTAVPTTPGSTAVPTTGATTTLPTAAPTTGTISSQSAYDAFDNTSTGWWFNHPVQLGQDIPSTITAPIADRLARYRGIWRQDTADKVIYLTMDEGYEYNNHTTRILDIAAEKNIKISFFITGDYLKFNPPTGPSGEDLVLRMVAEGHLVANHTWTHPNQATLIDTEGIKAMAEDIDKVGKAFTDLTGKSIAPFLRPPQGAYSERTLKVLSDLGYRAVFWSFAYRDWITTEQPNPASSLTQITGSLHPGAVYLLHAVSATNVQILPEFIDAALARGYRFALLDQIP